MINYKDLSYEDLLELMRGVKDPIRIKDGYQYSIPTEAIEAFIKKKEIERNAYRAMAQVEIKSTSIKWKKQ